MPTKAPRRTRRPRPSLTAEQIAARDQARLEKLDRALQQLRSDEGWGAWLSSRRSFRTYSLRNQLLIAMQAPHANRVAGFRKWQDLGWQVRKGSTAIEILAPITKKRDDGTEEVVGVKLAKVFTDADVDPIPGMKQAPLMPPEGSLAGTAQVGEVASLLSVLWDQLIAQKWASAIAVHPEYSGDSGGWHERETHRIGLVPAPPLDMLRVLIHEGIHAIAAPQGITYEAVGRGTCEGIVEAATFMVLDGLGVENTTSPAYIEGWNTAEPDLVKEQAQLILDLAKTIEGMLDAPAA